MNRSMKKFIGQNIDDYNFTRSVSNAFRRRFAIFLILTRFAFGERFTHSRWGGIVSIAEPLGLLAFFTISHNMTPSPPPFGSSTLLFFASGIIPFYLFFHLSSRIRSIDNYRPLAGATRIDHVLARATSETITKIFIFSLFVFATSFLESESMLPSNPFICLAALLTLASLGCGVGLINATIISFFPTWIYIYAVLGRIPLFLSGMPFVQDRAPGYFREVIVYAPFSHLITWFRSGFYEFYPTKTMDLQFAFSVCAVIVVVAVLVDDNTREFRSAD